VVAALRVRRSLRTPSEEATSDAVAA